jgi:hypothetical protein
MNRKTLNLCKFNKSYFALFAILSSAIFVGAQTGKMRLEINPSAKCGTDDICYKVVNFPKEGIAFDEIKSDFFYAVILKTTEKCGATEKDRRAAQTLFPKNKVFTSATDCELTEDRAFYENINEADNGFIAVYAGKTKPEADKFLQSVKTTGKFPGANIRRTRIILVGD